MNAIDLIPFNNKHGAELIFCVDENQLFYFFEDYIDIFTLLIDFVHFFMKDFVCIL